MNGFKYEQDNVYGERQIPNNQDRKRHAKKVSKLKRMYRKKSQQPLVYDRHLYYMNFTYDFYPKNATWDKFPRNLQY